MNPLENMEVLDAGASQPPVNPMPVMDNSQTVPASTGSPNNEPQEKTTFFLVYIFTFIILGIKSIAKYGTNAFNPGSVIDTTGQVGLSQSITKANEKAESRKTAIRSNPKYIRMKEELAQDLSSEMGQKLSEPVVYEYVVMDNNGKIHKNRFNGISKLDVNAFLVNEGYEVFSIKTNDKLNFLYGQSQILSTKMSVKDLIFWLTQLSTYLKAGIPLADAVRILANQMTHGKESAKNQIFNAIVYELSMGTAFSDALDKQGGVFPSLLINMLKAAEATGNLEETLDDMANYYSEIDSTRQQMKSAMTYPILVCVFAIGITVFILVYIVPQFVSIYESAGVALSGMTVFLIDLSAFLEKYILLIIMVIIIVVITFILIYKNVQPIRRSMQVFAMHMPIFGNVIIFNEITIFTKTFASLLKNNVFITESIDILSKITTNEIYIEIMFNTISNIARGEKISESFKDQWCVPDIAYFMIQTGESTGDLGNMMQKVSEYYGEQHKAMIESMKAFIEPVMIIFIAVVVGGILISVILPMFDLYSAISM